MRMFLTGFMGAGKSTLARTLASNWHVTLYDIDAVLETINQKQIHDQISNNLIQFRAQEKEIINELYHHGQGIVSLGGGAIEDEETRALLRGKPVLFLDPGVDICWQRVQADFQRRPLATDYDSFVALYNQRLPLYLSICRWHLTDNLPPEQLLHKLETLIELDNTPSD